MLDWNINAINIWPSQPEFLVGFAGPAVIAMALHANDKVRAGINSAITNQMFASGLALIAVHLVCWRAGWVHPGDLVNAHLITIPLLAAAIFGQQRLNPLSTALMTWSALFLIDWLCAAGFAISRQDLFFVTAIGSAGQGWHDGLVWMPISIAIVVASINGIRSLVASKKEFGISPDVA